MESLYPKEASSDATTAVPTGAAISSDQSTSKLKSKPHKSKSKAPVPLFASDPELEGRAARSGMYQALGERCERYFGRLISNVRKMRVRSKAVTQKHISTQQIMRMVGLVEDLFARLLNQRQLILSTAQQYVAHICTLHTPLSPFLCFVSCSDSLGLFDE